LSTSTPKPYRARFRFYAELNDFLPASKRQLDLDYDFRGAPSVKDAIEAQGIPHPEVDLIVVDEVSVGFDHRLRDGDRVAVYPVFEAIDISPVTRLRAKPLRETRFVVDVHLGKLARFLRLLGFDTIYESSAGDAEIIEVQRTESRVILTRDRGLLKSGAVTHGYWVRATDPDAQLDEVVSRFDLSSQAEPFTRCLACNGHIGPVDAGAVTNEAPPRVRRRHREFFRCGECRKLYWKGTHYDRLVALVGRATSAGEDNR
jgi:uncharacterized protein with PIN domain